MPAPATILVVDDTETNRVLLQRRLEEHGFRVHTTASGRAVMQLVQEHAVDLVLLDVMMPDVDGYQTLQQVRERYSLTQLPVIMLTALDDSNSVITALRLGANDYAVKPVDIQVLLGRIRNHLKLKSPDHQRVGQYELERRLGSGAMAVVFSARDMVNGRRVALKILPRSLTVNAEAVQRFLREAECLAKVIHPNVVRFFGAGQDGEVHYLAMELVEGPNFLQLCYGKPLDIPLALEVTRQVALGAGEIHAQGIVHRDIKPSNLLLCHQPGLIKIADFGVARSTETPYTLTGTGMAVGSIVFAAPEQLNGEPGPFSDMYSLGCTLAYLLTGTNPFPASKPLPWLWEQKNKKPPRLGEPVGIHFDAPLEHFVATLMQPKGKKRFASWNDVIEALQSLQKVYGMGDVRNIDPTVRDPAT